MALATATQAPHPAARTDERGRGTRIAWRGSHEPTEVREGEGLLTGTTRTTDPFGSTSGPATYLPRAASEAVLSALVSFLRVGATQLAVQGPAGIGKTMMLRLIEARLESELRSVYVPHPTLPADEIVPWILGLLDEPFAGDPDGALIELARRLEKGGSGLVLLIDDAGSMPEETLRHLAGLATEGHPALRLVFALPDDSRAERVIAAVPPGIASAARKEHWAGDT